MHELPLVPGADLFRRRRLQGLDFGVVVLFADPAGRALLIVYVLGC